MIGLVVPVLKNFRGLAELLLSVKSQWNMVSFYIIDNWRDPRCVAESWNQGITQALEDRCHAVLVCNDDVILSPMAIDNLYDRVDDNTMITGINMRDHFQTEDVWTFVAEEPEITDEAPDFSCFMITEKFYEAVGPFDTNFQPAYFEDNDYHYRIKLAGLSAERTTFAPIYHEGSVTQNMDRKNPVVPSRQFEQNRMYYFHKWGGFPGQEKFTFPYNDDKLSWREFK